MEIFFILLGITVILLILLFILNEILNIKSELRALDFRSFRIEKRLARECLIKKNVEKAKKGAI